METAPRIAEALSLSLASGEVGIQVAAYVGERLLVNQAAGLVSSESTTPVTSDTLFPIFSISKAVSAIALHIQAERGLIRYEDSVARYWPEFARNGKERISVQQVITHQSGIPHLPPGVTPERILDWDWMVRGIEDLSPAFEPGTRNAYQSLIHGWLEGELVERTDKRHRTYGEFVREEICNPLGIDDLWIGLPSSEFYRVALLSGVSRGAVDNPTPLYSATLPENLVPSPSLHNRPEVWRAGIPATGGIATAKAVATIFALLANGGALFGVRLLSEDRVRGFLSERPHAHELDLTLFGGNRVIPQIGQGGLWLSHGLFGGGQGVLCHSGAGGTVAWANTDKRFAVAICHNRMFDYQVTSSETKDHPFRPLRDAVFQALEEAVQASPAA